MLDRRTLIQSLSASAAAGAAPLPINSLAWPPRPDRELMVPVAGGRVYVRINGPLRGPRLPIIFVHGGPGENHGTLINALELSDERAVILYDQLDSGLSQRPNNPANWKISRFVDELDAVRRAVDVARLHLFGHSWGGTIALEYASRHSRALASVVLAGPLISTKAWLRDAVARRASLPQSVQATLAGCDPPAKFTRECEVAMQLYYSKFIQRDPPTAAHKDFYRRSRMESNGTIYNAMWGPSEFVSTGTLKQYDGGQLLGKLNAARTLFMVAQHDAVRVETAANFAERAGGADLTVVPGAAHNFLMDRPREAVGILRAWLASKDQ